MAKLLTIQIGENNPMLRTASVPVKKFDAVLKKFAKEMRETMIKLDGLGLAAPQVGENIRMIAVTMNYGSKNASVTIMINPEILSHGDETEVAEEGCLSLPGTYGKVERYKNIVVAFTDIDGEKYVLKLAELNARVVQHETDHLNAVLFIDRIKQSKKKNAVIM
ncbi:MAG: peptide deformylase [Candidatus Gracilibacteria bacterium]